MTSNVAGALCYLLWIVTGITFLIVEPYSRNRFVRFHAFQAILLFVALIIFRFIWYSILMGVFPVGFWGFFSIIGGLITLGFFLLWLFLMYKAYNNERFMVPVIGEIAARQADR